MLDSGVVSAEEAGKLRDKFAQVQAEPSQQSFSERQVRAKLQSLDHKREVNRNMLTATTTRIAELQAELEKCSTTLAGQQADQDKLDSEFAAMQAKYSVETVVKAEVADEKDDPQEAISKIQGMLGDITQENVAIGHSDSSNEHANIAKKKEFAGMLAHI